MIFGRLLKPYPGVQVLYEVFTVMQKQNMFTALLWRHTSGPYQDILCQHVTSMLSCRMIMLTCKVYLLKCDFDMLYVNMIMLHADTNKSHVKITIPCCMST